MTTAVRTFLLLLLASNGIGVLAQSPTPAPILASFPTTLSPTLSSAGVGPGAQCTICGGDLGMPNKTLFFVGAGQTCNSIEAFLNRANSTSDCFVRKNVLQKIPVDLPSWCACKGAQLPGVCPGLCSSGGVVIQANQEIEVQNITMTCKEAYDLNTYINNSTFCSDFQAISYKCCAGAQLPPTPEPTPFPTFAPSVQNTSAATSITMTGNRGRWGKEWACMSLAAIFTTFW